VELYENLTFNLYTLSQKKELILKDAFKNIPNEMDMNAKKCKACEVNDAEVLVSPCLCLVLCVSCSTNYKKIDGLKNNKCINCHNELHEFYDLTMQSKTDHKKCRIF
jgi:hypothetical protein